MLLASLPSHAGHLSRCRQAQTTSPEEFEQVVCEADQAPLASGLAYAAKREASIAACLLDLANHVLNDHLAPSVLGAPIRRAQFPAHLVACIEVIGGCPLSHSVVVIPVLVPFRWNEECC